MSNIRAITHKADRHLCKQNFPLSLSKPDSSWHSHQVGGVYVSEAKKKKRNAFHDLKIFP